jgi:UTP--glucose-1-phosphate uridylyltransferase
MKVTKAIITAAGKGQRSLPLQTLIDRDGQQKSILSVIIEEVARAGISDMCFIIHPEDERAFRSVAGDYSRQLAFVYQYEPRGYGHALWCARDYAQGEPFLHLVGDHLYLSRTKAGCAQRVVEAAEAESCAVSAVQATREGLLQNFGAVGGKHLRSGEDLYVIETVIEKPTPTVAEQQLVTPGLRAGHYLCFFGIHVLTPTLMEILDREVSRMKDVRVTTISDALRELAQTEKYLALEMYDYRYNVGVKYGLLNAQLALALSGRDRDEVLAMLMEMLLLRERPAGEKEQE